MRRNSNNKGRKICGILLILVFGGALLPKKLDQDRETAKGKRPMIGNGISAGNVGKQLIDNLNGLQTLDNRRRIRGFRREDLDEIVKHLANALLCFFIRGGCEFVHKEVDELLLAEQLDSADILVDGSRFESVFDQAMFIVADQALDVIGDARVADVLDEPLDDVRVFLKELQGLCALAVEEGCDSLDAVVGDLLLFRGHSSGILIKESVELLEQFLVSVNGVRELPNFSTEDICA